MRLKDIKLYKNLIYSGSEFKVIIDLSYIEQRRSLNHHPHAPGP